MLEGSWQVRSNLGAAKLTLALPLPLCNDASVPKKIPDYIAVSPITLKCPRCKAEPGTACVMPAVDLDVIHLERIEAAVVMDVAAKKARKK